MKSKSESITNLLKALSLTQQEISDATKNATNPHFKKEYADLSSVLEEIRSASAKHGISFTQYPYAENGTQYVGTIVGHSSGEYIEYQPISALITKQDPQGLGILITYLRRYSIAAIFGIAQKDDDANSISGKPEQQTTAKKQTTSSGNKATDAFKGLLSSNQTPEYIKSYAEACLGQSIEEHIEWFNLMTIIKDKNFTAEKKEKVYQTLTQQIKDLSLTFEAAKILLRDEQ